VNLPSPQKAIFKGNFLLLLSLFCVAPHPSAAPYGHYQLTRWHDPLGRSPQSFQEFQKKAPPAGDFILGPVEVKNRPREKKALASTGEILILVHADLFPKIVPSLTIYSDDLLSQGYSVAIDTISGGDASHLRICLQRHWVMYNLQGAILVGDLPVAWFKMYNSWNEWEE
jgi:hypothetical protein